MFKRIFNTLMTCACLLSMPEALTAGLNFVETADGHQSPNTRELVQWTHSRLVFKKDLVRVAVGQNETMEVEILGGREALVLAKQVGRTSLIVWYPDDTTETFLFSVVEDLSVLRHALADIHPDILIELAPDRAALVLRGTVPTMVYRVAAEAAARNYFAAGVDAGQGGSGVVVDKDSMGSLLDLAKAATGNLRVGLPSGSKDDATIINLIQVRELPRSPEQKILQAIRDVGGDKVTVERIRHGDVDSNSDDTLLLKGTVKNQISLIRVLNVAAKLFANENAGVDPSQSIQAVADESGSLIGNQTDSPPSGGLGGGGGLGNQGGSGSMQNAISANVGRAKLLSVAGGRILSVIEVEDLPQVRVSVQLHEVDRDRMKNWRPELTAVTGGFAAESMSSGGSGLVIQPDGSARVGAAESRQIENALQVLGGALSNQLQLGGSDIAFDLLFSLLENEGISRTLSKPTITVLAGEAAVFQVGGEVPVPTAFAPAGVSSGDSTGGVFSGTEFKQFGVQLMVRPMVGEDDRITLDVRPTISSPDSTLTQIIAGTTGASLNSTAFSTRSLDTTTRLRDGQALIIGGLVSRRISEAQAYTPGVHRVPFFGKLAQASQTTDSDRELIIIVTPTIVREPIENLPVWEFESSVELMHKAISHSGIRTVNNDFDDQNTED